jgi:photosystem II stability/assembly factor-like uncharacterized protein
MAARTASAVLLLALVVSVPLTLAQSRNSGKHDRSAAAAPAPPRVTSSLLDALPFRLIGPASPAGRVWQLQGVPAPAGKLSKTWYVCTADGGVWKTSNDGTTLDPIFNDQPAASCGAVAVAPGDPNVVWVGTGEPASTRANSLGRGVFRSDDGGATWEYVGLENTEEITAVIVDPRNTKAAWVAALGHLWGKNPERGIFKTVDGGQTWKQSLFIDDATGFSDLAMDPHNPDVLYAAAWARMRLGNGDMTESASTGGIYKTTDGGLRWTKLTNGLPATATARIYLAVAPRNSNIIYATIQTGENLPGGGGGGGIRTVTTGGIFRSTDAGATWTRVNPQMTNYYYGKIVVDPASDDRIWLPWFELLRSDDGGRTLVKHNMKHVHNDLHSIWIDPNDPGHLVIGGDGGVNTSVDRGRTWVQNVLPIAQFYDVAADDQDPYYVYGGMQDTGHWTGPSQTYDNEGITNYDWIKLRYNGDGMAVVPKPHDPNVIYMVQEYGNTSRLNLRLWTRTELQPKTANLAPSTPAKDAQDPKAAQAAKAEGAALRWDWTPPMFLALDDPNVLYLGANVVFRCHVGVGGSPPQGCVAISPDLTAQRGTPTVSGVKQGYHSYGALFALAQSPADPKVLWAGSDDGPIHVTRDAGKTWVRVDEHVCAAVASAPSPVPSPAAADAWRALASKCHVTRGVSRVEPSRTAAGAAYLVYDLHTLDDRKPYLFKTTDFGASWTSITNDLPAGPAYLIREDPANPRVLYVGTEWGLYISIDAGQHWVRWKSNLPMAAVRSMVVQPHERELVVGTFGRAIWIGSVHPLAQLEEALRCAAAEKPAPGASATDACPPAFLFDVPPATAYNIRYTYGATIEELNGDMFFRAPNPPYGATISYYLRRDVGHVQFAILDAAGKIVRTLQSPGTMGLHQVTWDLETDAAKAQKPAPESDDEPEFTLSELQAQRRVPPGTYTVELHAGGAVVARPVVVKPESDGVQRVQVRK